MEVSQFRGFPEPRSETSTLQSVHKLLHCPLVASSGHFGLGVRRFSGFCAAESAAQLQDKQKRGKNSDVNKHQVFSVDQTEAAAAVNRK